MEANRVINADCLDWMREQPDNSVDLVFGSPPYEAARTYGIGFKLRGQEWVDWMVERIVEMVRICKGLVAMVVEGQTRKFRWSAAPALLMADLHRAGVCLRKPPAFHRVGIPGSGGPDWLRNDYEFIVCASKGKLPYSDNTAMGHPPKWRAGGMPSHRLADGTRVNDPWLKRGRGNNLSGRKANGEKLKGNGRTPFGSRPSEACGREGYKKTYFNGNGHPGRRRITKQKDGMHGGQENTFYQEPILANPGNVIKCIVGGGVMGSKLAAENEAPFPERLAEFFVRSFCPPGGIVLDPFTGSGTTARVAQRHGRQYIALDVRQSQCDLTLKRLAEPEPQPKKAKKVKPLPSQKSLFS